ncbi:MAG: subtilase [Halobacteriovorax sp.]|nr:subtilase [Halobacteriovorax sp.]|tara:strand:- start:44106 stop:45386 length:1281 start_codon:yes stop_codon:yes gene_type:complete
MKTLILLVFLVLGAAANASDFEYLVKLETSKGQEALESLNLMGKTRTFQTSFGEFAVLKTKRELEISDFNYLHSKSAIQYVDRNIQIKVSPIEPGKSINAEDASFKKQWGLKNTGWNGGPIWRLGKKGEDINAEKAWGLSRGRSTIKIAVIDTGVDYDHPDLKNNILMNEAEFNGVDGVDDDGNGYVDDVFGYDFANNDADPMDGHGHGTHCAGVIGATHNRSGIRGVMGRVKVLPIKFLGDNGSGTLEGAVRAIDYAIKMKVHVMSNSWGGGGANKALLEAIKAADEAGIVFVAAAGNSTNNNDKNPSYPASYQVDNIISVGSMDGNGKKSWFSNYGKKSVHIFAPGSDILSTVKNGKYKKMSGTSMATPFVSGAIGLLLTHEKNMTPKEIRERLMATSVKNKTLVKYAASGRLDAYRLLKDMRN